VTLFFSNANIAPHDEFLKRLATVRQLSEQWEVPLLVDEPDHADWLAQAAAGLESEREKGLRCERCFRYSLGRTQAAMASRGFDGFTTTLTVSPHKHTPTLFQVGRSLDAERFLAVDFKKSNGFQHSLKLSAELGLYRQSWCGCEFSARG
jgi:predicted adenine nucleotide alpha hydrolase (AANH) superfamily ATPase